jgi:transposase
MSSPVLSAVREDSAVVVVVVVLPGRESVVRVVGRSFTPIQKLEFLTAHETACESNEGGAFLRREGLYSS